MWMDHSARCSARFEKLTWQAAALYDAARVARLLVLSNFDAIDVSLRPGDRPVVIGRAGDVRVCEDQIEKKHARFALRDGRLFVAPLGKALVSVGKRPASAEVEVAAGDVVLLSGFVAVYVEGDEPAAASAAPSACLREAIERLAGYGRTDRLLAHALASSSPALVRAAYEVLSQAPAIRLGTVASHLRAAMERAPLAASFGGFPSLRALVDAPPPPSAVLVEAERRAQAKAAPGHGEPIDEDADPEHDGGQSAPTKAWNVRPTGRDVGHGWCHGAPPFAAAEWPRSPYDGAPMRHLGTLLVPAEYRARGPRRVAVAIFQADEPSRRAGSPLPRGGGDVELLEDSIGRLLALCWLDRERFARGPSDELPAGMVARPTAFLELRARKGDRSVGKPIADDDALDERGRGEASGSEPGASAYTWSIHEVPAHFGGTAINLDNRAAGYSPVYLELEDGFGGANFGGDNAQIELTTGRVSS
jgi:hypothetical protein